MHSDQVQLAISVNLWYAGDVRTSSRKTSGLVLTGLDCVDGSIGERTHRTGYKANQHVLIRWELLGIRLELGCKLLEFLVCGEVDA